MRIHKEGYRIIFNSLLIITVIVALFFIFTNSLMVRSIVGTVGVLILILIVRFFREPHREPLNEDDSVTSPADGTIVEVKPVYEGEFLKAECIQVSVFMSVFNVHVNWFPVKGFVEYYKYHPGKYLVAMHPKSSEKNERTTVVINNLGTRVLIRQIAGLIARRIVCYAKEGSAVSQGDQVGFIKFGSRVDIFLPSDARIQVTKGQKVKGNITIIAKLPLS
ncbi:MAG: phosphatidylserine decarboxylase [Bacteroidetes bacterium GWE2_39_28]|nr:MAG: phosphatidylserine decarboxylase [Bacteroidetes bacterium GWE2_39_28]OFY12800.1 MAG: phosphatidylserine decarboxylase [Bacteroidetes bacterium GWF2_39_10]OFZ11023.1 MAG: phosphatidylserine decarboxylase [Bacteroidetes bacterium RIFOXYC2_FULL_39_11]HCT93721.1 phosphatidylserine decarboxylase family protein [Rikenellaceae bacterium]HCV15920.1 phosphatidylserine decarboxylase family protein [Rikenellaceae bacterium]